MHVDHHRLGVGIAAAGLLLLFTLRAWASPLALAVTGRPRVGVVAFLGIPIFLIVVGTGIAIFLWGDRLGLA